MEIPSFADLSKCARDILNSGYQYGKGVAKISFKTKSKSHLEVDSNFTLDQADLTVRFSYIFILEKNLLN